MPPSILSSSSCTLLANWQNSDPEFFRKYSKDARAMQIISALAETIATYGDNPTKPTPFYC